MSALPPLACLHDIHVAPSCLYKLTISRELPPDWPVKLGIDLTSYMLWYMELKTTSNDATWLLSVIYQRSNLWLPVTLIRSACGITKTVCNQKFTVVVISFYTECPPISWLPTTPIMVLKNYLKWQEIQLAIHWTVNSFKSLNNCIIAYKQLCV